MNDFQTDPHLELKTNEGRLRRFFRGLGKILQFNVISPLDINGYLPDEAAELSAERRAWTRRTVVTILAASSAWALGSLINSADALVATILVLVTLRVSLHASMNEAIGQLLGVGVGVGVAFATSETFGASLLSVATIIATSLLLSRCLRLGDDGAVNIAITSLIVLGPGLETDTALNRLIGTGIGVTVAVIASYFMQGSSPLTRTNSKVAELHRESSRLLREMSLGLRNGYDIEMATVWLANSRMLVSVIPDLRTQAFEAIRYARWSPFAQSDEAEAAHQRFIEAEHTAVQVRTIARNLYDSIEKQISIPQLLRNSLSVSLENAALLIGGQRDVLIQGPSAQTDENVADTLRSSLDHSAGQLTKIENVAALSLSGALITNVERIADTLQGVTSAVTEVPVVSVEGAATERIVDAVTRPTRSSSRKRRFLGRYPKNLKGSQTR